MNPKLRSRGKMLRVISSCRVALFSWLVFFFLLGRAAFAEQAEVAAKQLQDVATMSDIQSLTELAKEEVGQSWKIARLRLFLMDPLIEAWLGNTKVSVTWKPLSRTYRSKQRDDLQDMTIHGENIKVAVSGGNLRDEISDSWKTALPDETVVSVVSFSGYSRISSADAEQFRPADINIRKLVVNLLLQLPQDAWAKFVLADQATAFRSSLINDALLEYFTPMEACSSTNLFLLEKLSIVAKNLDVREAASEKIAEIVMSDLNADGRLAAVEKLVDQIALEKIAIEDGDRAVRCAAVSKLNNQTLLSKLASDDLLWKVRLAAVEKLTNSVVLSKIAAENSDRDVRLAASNRQAKVATENKAADIQKTTETERLETENAAENK